MSNKRPPTEPQLEVLAFVKQFVKANKYSPTVEDIREFVGDTYRSSVYQKLRSLRSKGYVTWEDGVSRTIRPTSKRLA